MKEKIEKYTLKKFHKPEDFVILDPVIELKMSHSTQILHIDVESGLAGQTQYDHIIRLWTREGKERPNKTWKFWITSHTEDVLPQFSKRNAVPWKKVGEHIDSVKVEDDIYHIFHYNG